MEAEPGLAFAVEPRPISARGFEQGEGAFHVRLDERARPVDASVHMAFGGEVQNRPRLMFGQERVEQRAIGDVALDEAVSVVVGQ